jgi:hypothetical protein
MEDVEPGLTATVALPVPISAPPLRAETLMLHDPTGSPVKAIVPPALGVVWVWELCPGELTVTDIVSISNAKEGAMVRAPSRSEEDKLTSMAPVVRVRKFLQPTTLSPRNATARMIMPRDAALCFMPSILIA